MQTRAMNQFIARVCPLGIGEPGSASVQPLASRLADTDPILKIEQLAKRFGSTTALDEIGFDVRKGEFISLLGPSGSGKTTVLRIIGGFERPSSGRVILSGKDVVADPPYRRNIGVVFQSYALFPHMTAAQNIEFPLKHRRHPARRRKTMVAEALELVGLGGLAERYPNQMSGGQQQRVALARAIVFEPDILLLDEPLAALDKQLRQRMQAEIRSLQRRIGITAIFVTHDQGEAMAMSDRIAVINHGRIEQIGTPNELYERPSTRFVASFIGESNLLACVAAGQVDALTQVRLEGGHLVLSCAAIAPESETLLLVRPEKISLDAAERSFARRNSFRGQVREAVYLGDAVSYAVETAAGLLKAKVTTRADQRVYAHGDVVWANWAPDDSILLQR